MVSIRPTNGVPLRKQPSTTDNNDEKVKEEEVEARELTLEEELALGHVPVSTKVHWSYYLGLLVVLPVWIITPLSWIFLGVQAYRYGPTLLSHNAGWIQKVFVLWTGSEVLFSIYHAYLVRKLARRPANIERASLHRLRQVFHHILHVGLSPDGSIPPLPTPRSRSSSQSNTYPNNTNNNTNTNNTTTTTSNNNPKSFLQEIPLLSPSDPRAIDFRESLRTWFSKSSWSSLTRAHFRTWLSWSMFYSSYDHLTAEHRELVHAALEMVERRCGVRLPEGPTMSLSLDSKGDSDSEGSVVGKNRPLRLTLDPLSVWGRPLVAYLVINGFGYITKQGLVGRFGVRYERVGSLEYLIREAPQSQSSSAPPPLLFLHGLGIGITQYIVFISSLLSNPALSNRTIIIPLQPHISQEIFDWEDRHLSPRGMREMLGDLRGVVERVVGRGGKGNGNGNGSKGKVVVVSHSNGTVLHAWLLKAHPELITASCFVDPVTFCLWEGDVCYNFVYRQPTNMLDVLMRYFVGSEIGIANYIQRNFDWSSNTLFFEDIPDALNPDKTMFYLGGGDSILSADRVRRYLKLHGLTDENLVYTEGAPHGEALITGGPVKRRIVDWIVNVR